MIIDQHVGVFEKAYTKDFCNKQISFFENNIKVKRNSKEVQDESVSLKYNDEDFQKIFWNKHYIKYIEKYKILNNVQTHSILDIKIQKTKPEEGYPLWHCENMSLHDRNRIMSFILYLNTVEDGETEFLDQRLKIKPEEGKLVIWPAVYTHVHKGNSPKDNKYIITGWIEYSI